MVPLLVLTGTLIKPEGRGGEPPAGYTAQSQWRQSQEEVRWAERVGGGRVGRIRR